MQGTTGREPFLSVFLSAERRGLGRRERAGADLDLVAEERPEMIPEDLGGFFEGITGGHAAVSINLEHEGIHFGRESRNIPIHLFMVHLKKMMLGVFNGEISLFKKW